MVLRRQLIGQNKQTAQVLIALAHYSFKLTAAFQQTIFGIFSISLVEY